MAPGRGRPGSSPDGSARSRGVPQAGAGKPGRFRTGARAARAFPGWYRRERPRDVRDRGRARRGAGPGARAPGALRVRERWLPGWYGPGDAPPGWCRSQGLGPRGGADPGARALGVVQTGGVDSRRGADPGAQPPGWCRSQGRSPGVVRVRGHWPSGWCRSRGIWLPAWCGFGSEGSRGGAGPGAWALGVVRVRCGFPCPWCGAGLHRSDARRPEASSAQRAGGRDRSRRACARARGRAPTRGTSPARRARPRRPRPAGRRPLDHDTLRVVT